MKTLALIIDLLAPRLKGWLRRQPTSRRDLVYAVAIIAAAIILVALVIAVLFVPGTIGLLTTAAAWAGPFVLLVVAGLAKANVSPGTPASDTDVDPGSEAGF
ncbi:hypothetical protein [Nocardioides sp.]|uniref:hypothetical protein n=1 Tax=Nocardioides sp. TaxID=35761 RepID=UPI0026217810|nr:hypothetical protein [Nocardioides sp.]